MIQFELNGVSEPWHKSESMHKSLVQLWKTALFEASAYLHIISRACEIVSLMFISTNLNLC